MSEADGAAADRAADMPGTSNRLRRFQQLNQLLWLCWLGLLIWAGIVFWRAGLAVPANFAGAPPEAINCLRLLPNPAGMSLTGKILYWSLLAFKASFFFIAFWILHRMVRKFASGRIFVFDTLAGLKSLGFFFTVWPFIQSAVQYGIEAALKANQDIPSYWPMPFNVNFGIAAMGLFLFALKAVMENAIDIKTDSDLTI
jgi:hypothetical protein